MLKIGLLWHSVTSDNLGVGALTESQMAIIKEAADGLGLQVEFLVMGTTGGKNYSIVDKKVTAGIDVSLKRILVGASKFPKAVRRSDIVFDIGEGDSFADIYGQSRFNIQILSKFICQLFNKPLILSPQTIGPFAKSYNRTIASYVIKKCRKVFARDNLSFDYLVKNGNQDNALEVIDVAFKLPYTKSTVVNNKFAIGINVSGLLYNGGYTKDNQFGLTVDYPKLVHELIEKLHQKDNVEIWLVPHVITDTFPVEDDYQVSLKLQEKYPFLKIAPKFESPSQAKSFISKLNFFTGARMHACIAAFSSGVPVIPMAYSRKFNGLFGSLNYFHVADCRALSNQQVIEMIIAALDNVDSIKANVDSGNEIAFKRLEVYRSYIVDVLSEIAKKTRAAKE